MDDFINQLSGAISAFDAGWIMGLAAVVTLLTNLTKVAKLKEWIPATARKWVALGLGIASGVLSALVEGKPLLAALMQGAIVGVSAIGTHEVTTPLTSKVASKASKGATTMVLIIVASTTIPLQQGCSWWQKGGKESVNKCAKPAVQDVISSSIPIALALVDKLTDKDGAVDWNAFADTTKASGWDAAVCMFDETLKRFLVAKAKAGPSPVPHMDNELQKERAQEARAKAFAEAQ